MVLEYKRYNSPQWKEIARQVRIRDNMTCQMCGRKVWGSDSHVHHIVPLSQGGTTTLDNLILLCSDCHSKVHNRYLNVRNRKNKRIDIYV